MSNQLKTFVSELSPVTHQIGSHIMSALSEANTAAVLTSLVPGFPQDRIASIPVTRAQLQRIHQLLAEEQRVALEATEKEEQDRSIGFHVDIPDSPDQSDGQGESG